MPDKNFWESQYSAGTTGWDIGMPSPPLSHYLDQISRKDTGILIPGAGNAHEALYALQQGFTNVTVVDFAAPAIAGVRKKTCGFPAGHLRLVEADFFSHPGEYDLILEQTFFCAIEPERRAAYARHCHQLLAPGGKLAGVLFNTEFQFGPPPFGGRQEDYRELFSPWFHFHTWEPCKDSFPARAGSEWFMILEKKQPATDAAA